METLNFNKLLLKTAFSCMACDGDIDQREINLIKRLHKDNKAFGEIEINRELDTLLLAINKDGHRFLKNYFSELTTTQLSEASELKLIEVAIDTIKADEKVEYNEIKFFKVIRSKLKIDDKLILEKHPDFEEYLEQDIFSESYLLGIQSDFFDTSQVIEFKLLNLDDSIINKEMDEKE